MYNMEVESPLFKGKTLVAQHRMVNEVSAPGGLDWCMVLMMWWREPTIIDIIN